MHINVLADRRSGILLHPTSLPSGRLDGDVLRWLDFLAAAGQSVWQVLPLGIPCAGRSPYQCLSSFAANPALLPEDAGTGTPQSADPQFRRWVEQRAFWLEDFTIFMLLKRQHHNRPWYEWPADCRDRDPATLDRLRQAHAAELEQLRWEQYRLHRTWKSLHAAANERGIYIFGDMPIFVAHDSADVWSCPERFLLDAQGQLTYATGVPPDYFSATGQRWGNPHYDWQHMEDEGFSWWLQRLDSHFEWFDLLRIDHFRGLEAVWMIEADCETAVDGHWAKIPGDALLTALQRHMGEIPLVAEDLGIITPEVTALRKRYSLPGMAVLQFSFDESDDNPHKPRNIVPDTVVYTGTHDNDTTRGWFDALPAGDQQQVLAVLGISDPAAVVDAMMKTALESRAQLCILPLQDILGLGTEARMNRPGDDGDHWRWRFDWSQITMETTHHIREMSCHAGRC
ncbi:MAG: 4-alpha-glucanotransferase [Thiohalobacterales bacterium]|nr:4-alpha-glucanotransferase [Thiohalobacterales bacterium]